ncbi:glutamate receptor 2.2-like [Mangifera indica]|uniref:glutamate receptor 2.2-like n=1 Tax=Mangifera indica TaxID=29780 RepID=UPI001CFB91A5|nr:glutamate receptor 2.2-like [Mangifera indica]
MVESGWVLSTSLTSLLTVQSLQPTVSDVAELIKRGENVGNQQGSFVVGILKQLGFKDKNLLVYDSVEECDALFQNGTANVGIAAAFDEVPYIKVFLGKYCSKYSMVDPTFRTAGFGFAFPLGSPLVPEISRAILNVTKGAKVNEIEDAWFKKNSSRTPAALFLRVLALTVSGGCFSLPASLQA